MCITGHNSYQGCCFCHLQGICANNKHIYYLLSPPKQLNNIHYKPGTLSERTHQSYLLAINNLENSWTKSKHAQSIKASDINGRSILFELRSIKFPDSFPVDIMHGLFENVAPAMFWHWTGTLLKENDAFNISTDEWKQVESVIEKNWKNMLYMFECPLVDILRHSNVFKVEEWTNWVILYSTPLLSRNLDKRSSKNIINYFS